MAAVRPSTPRRLGTPALLVLASLGGLAAGTFFHRHYWLEPAPASVSPTTAPAGLGAPASGPNEPIPAFNPSPERDAVPASDLAPHPAAVAEVTRLIATPGTSIDDLDVALARLGVADFPDVLNQPNLKNESDIKKALLSRWAELDPRAAARFLISQQKNSIWNAGVLMGEVLSTWLATSIPAGSLEVSEELRREILGWIEQVPSRSQGWALYPVLHQWMEIDPEGAIQLYLKRHKTTLGGYAPPFFERVAAHDPQRALELAAIQPQWLQAMVIGRVISTWAEKAPQTALAWMRQHPDLLSAQVGTLFLTWSQRQPEEALAAATGLPPGRERDHALAMVAYALGDADPIRMKAWPDAQPPSLWRTEMELRLNTTLAYQDSALAVATAAALPASAARTEALRRALEIMVEQDPEKAAALALHTMPPGAGRDTVLTGLSGWARQDPGAALTWMQRHSPDSKDAMSEIIGEGARWQTAATLDWIKTQPDSETRNGWFTQFITQETVTDPVQAAQRLLEWPASAELRDAADEVARSWAPQDPEATAIWAAQLGHPNQREAAYARLASEWGAVAPKAAADWLGQLPAGRERDVAIENFAEAVPAESQELAAKWSEVISDQTLRLDTLGKLLNDWKRADPAAVTRYLHDPSSQLPPADQAALRARFSRP